MFQIRPCRLEDFNSVVDLLRQLWPDRHLEVESLRTVFARGVAAESQAYFCVVAGGRVVGFGSLTLKNNLWQEGYLAHVDELVVDREFRGKGAGTQLLGHLVAFAQQKGCRRVELDSAFHRKDAHEFYWRHGFEDRALLFSKVL
ncbi:MAG: GNAT family N-acetyltransferase [Verrucomicrobiota bacterium]